jgi:3-deoxy-D-manno-octulosonic-acid transferase
MTRILMFLYNMLGIPLSFFGASIAGLMNPKIRKGLQGRKKIIKKVQTSLSIINVAKPRIWIHVSSYGEFLQVKPVLIELKKFKPDIFIIVSFFSPSGYDTVMVEQPIDFKCYLPFDSYFGAKKFIAAIAPLIAVIVRHDIWPNFVWRLKQENIPLILIDASIQEKSYRLLPVLKIINRKLFSLMQAILAISDDETARLRQLVDNPEKIIVVGDTKYDQVFERSQHLDRISQLLEVPALKDKKIFVVGSSWQTDEEFLIPAFQQLHQQFKDLIMILAPHEPTSDHLEQIEHQLEQSDLTSIRLSQLKPGIFNCHCLIIDKIGLLANIYYLGKVAFVGGSFHYKIHNVLEPAVYGIPVLFGPKMTNSSEAKHLLKHDAAILVKSTQQIVDVIKHLLENPEQANKYGERARQIVMQNVGSSEKIAQFLIQYLSAVNQ